jgi:hypothetical protein
MVINFFGRRGSGKTTTIRGNLPDFKPPVIVIDILGNFHNIQSTQTQTLKDTISEIEKYYEKTKDNPYSEHKVIVLHARNMNLCVDFISAALWEIGGGTLVCDEVDEIQASEAKCFEDAIRYGRNAGNYNGIHIITGCRRPAELGPLGRNLTASANKFYCFGTHDSRDADFFAGAGFGDRALELLTVPPFSGLFLDYDKQIIGRFHIDRQGHIFHDEVSAVSGPRGPRPVTTTVPEEGGPSLEPDQESVTPGEE